MTVLEHVLQSFTDLGYPGDGERDAVHGVDPGRGHHNGHEGQGQSLDLLDTGTDKCPASHLG